MTECGKDDGSSNVPKDVATAMMAIPPLVLKLGIGYLSMKRRIRKNARSMEAVMKENGLPEHLAHRLSARYQEDARLFEGIIRATINKDTLMCWRSTNDSETGN